MVEVFESLDVADVLMNFGKEFETLSGTFLPLDDLLRFEGIVKGGIQLYGIVLRRVVRQLIFDARRKEPWHVFFGPFRITHEGRERLLPFLQCPAVVGMIFW